ncbi:GDSL-type esterase/lipase family protein, partial [Algoriphagus sp.]|uniref:SGNH/GDSL hydrolase family protein n=1 Tax=Algoriphagus sp. TaxID=1872435 RepID=UPI0025F8D7AD
MKFLLALVYFFLLNTNDFYSNDFMPKTSDYLQEIKHEMTKEWPNNRTINLVFHGHSVPAGYFKTPIVNTLDSYPFQVLKELKKKYPFAVINVINTSIGGENSTIGEKRFKKEVLSHSPDVLFIDYALNDRRIGLTESKKAWEKMIKMALKEGVKIILLTPSPDLNVDLTVADNELERHRNQITSLSQEYEIGMVDSYTLFKQIQEKCDCVADYMSQGNH